MEEPSPQMQQTYRRLYEALRHPFLRRTREMEKPMYPAASRDIAKKREEFAPETLSAWRAFSRQVFAEGALPAKTKELIAVAIAHVTQCPWCIRHHTAGARARGASGSEIMEAIWIAAEMKAGAAIAHSALALDEIEEKEPKPE